MPDIEIDITVQDPRWESLFPALENITRDTILKTTPYLDLENDTEISVSFVGDADIQVLNRDYRNKNKPTNVLSFPQDEPNMLGDIVLAYETLAREASEQNKKPEDHLRHLLVHGTLHLVGYDHEEDGEADDMENLEAEILGKMGIKNPYEAA